MDAGLADKIIKQNKLYDLAPIQIVIPPPLKVYNPILQDFVRGSDYLHHVFQNNYFAYWFATLVTFYRHHHIRSYDASWQNEKYGRENETYRHVKSHENFRIIVNNRAKRQLIRAIFNDRKVTRFGAIRLIRSVEKLAHTDQETSSTMKNFLRKLGMC